MNDSARFIPDVGTIWSALSQMQSNANYMRRELPNVPLTPDLLATNRFVRVRNT